MSHDHTWFGPVATSSGLTGRRVGGLAAPLADLAVRRAASGTWSTPSTGRCPRRAAWRRRVAGALSTKLVGCCSTRRTLARARPRSAPAAAALARRSGSRWRRAAGGGGGSSVACGRPTAVHAGPDPDQRRELGDRLVDHVSVSPPLVAARCRWRAAPAARRVFPAPRSPCGPCPARPASRSFSRRSRAFSRSRRSAGGRPGGLGQRLAARPGRAACATPRSATCTGPRGAAARPCRPGPAPRTRPGSCALYFAEYRPAAWPARGPRGRRLAHPPSMDAPARRCRHRVPHQGGSPVPPSQAQ